MSKLQPAASNCQPDATRHNQNNQRNAPNKIINAFDDIVQTVHFYQSSNLISNFKNKKARTLDVRTLPSLCIIKLSLLQEKST